MRKVIKKNQTSIRIVGLLIAAVMVFALVACSSGKNAEPTGETIESKATQSTPSTESITSEELPPEIEIFPNENMRLLWGNIDNSDVNAHLDTVKDYGFTGIVVDDIDILQKITVFEDLTVYIKLNEQDDLPETVVNIAKNNVISGIIADGNAETEQIELAHKEIRDLNLPVAFGVIADDGERITDFINSESVDFIIVKQKQDTDISSFEEKLNDSEISLFFMHDTNENENDLVKETEEASKAYGYKGSIYTYSDGLRFNEQIAKLASHWQGKEFVALKKLKLISPQETDISTYDKTLDLQFDYNIEKPVLIDGTEISVDESGSFTQEISLTVGKNEITLQNGDDEINLTVRRKLKVIESVSPQNSVTADGGTVIELTVKALADAKVSATVNGQTFTMTKQDNQDESSNFSLFATSFRLPDATDEKQNLGRITFKATSNGYTQTETGGRVYVNKAPIVENNDVKMVTVKVERNAENKEYGATYPPKYSDDLSVPTHYHLPKGSIDYVVDEKDAVVNGVQKSYYVLSSGVMIYKSDCSLEYVEEKQINSLNSGVMTTDGRYSTLTFDMTLPVAVVPTLKPISFQKPHGSYGYLISSFDANKIEFLFSNTVNTCDISDLTSSPLFSSYEWQKIGDSQVKLILHFNESGKFHGFLTYFNSNGQFVIRFKNTIAATEADNEYGYSLEGVRVTLDAGHNGRYPYESGADGYDGKICEAEINLEYALLIKEELEAVGATVLLTRSENNVTMSEHERVEKIRNTECDALIAIHQNGNVKSSKYGTSSYYFYPYAMPLAEEINKSLVEAYRTHIYTSGEKYYGCDEGCEFYPYYMTRIQDFPCVLIETGYITNEEEYGILTNDEYQKLLAKAYARGIINYFASLA